MTIPLQKSGILGLNANIDKKTNPYIPGSDLYVLDGWYLSEALSVTKRKGFQKFNTVQLLDDPPSSAFTGLFEYVPSAGTAKKVATTTVGLYVFGTPVAASWNAISLAAAGGARTGTYANLYDAVILNDQMYIGGGASTDKNIRFTGTAAYQMGMDAPATTPTVAVAAGGSMVAGVYSFKVTFVNELGQESNPSTKTADATIVGGSGNYTVNLTNIPVSTDTQVTKRNIYRTTVDGAVWLLLATINDNTTTTYSSTDTDASLTLAVEQFANGVPVHFDMIETFKGIAFMAGDPAHKSRIAFSANGKPACVDSNDWRDLDPNDGYVVTGLKRFGITVVAFKGDSIWNASGENRDTIEFDRKKTGVGSVNNAGIVEVPTKDVLLFMSPNARFYAYDGVNAEMVATGLEPILNGLNAGRLSAIVGCAIPWLNQVRWIVPNGASNYNDLIIWYDYALNKWGTITITSTPGNYCAAMKDNASRVQFYLGGISDAGSSIDGGYVWQGDSGGTDDGTPITCEVTDHGHPQHNPNPENLKTFSLFTAFFKPTAGATLSVYGYKNDPDGTPVLLGTIDASLASGQGQIGMNQTARRLYIRVVESSSIQGLVLRGWNVFYKDIGRSSAP